MCHSLEERSPAPAWVASDPGTAPWCCCLTCRFFPRQTEQLLELLTTEILHPDSEAPNGVKSHFIEIFLEELTKVGAHEVGGRQPGRARWAVAGCSAPVPRELSPSPLPAVDRGPEPQAHRALLHDCCPDSGVSAVSCLPPLFH